jgi:hypothetical protein
LGLPSEFLFAARSALFAPILVTQAVEHAHQVSGAVASSKAAIEEQVRATRSTLSR